MGCMTTQMIHEAGSEWDGQPKKRPDLMVAPKNEKMKERGGGMFDESQPNERKKQVDNDTVVEIGDMLMPWEEEAVKGGAKPPPKNQRMNRSGGGEPKEDEHYNVADHSQNHEADGEIEVTPHRRK